MAGFRIGQLTLGAGIVGLCPIPGGGRVYAGDLGVVLDWRPDIVLVLSEAEEIRGPYMADLARAGVGGEHLPIPDMGTPSGEALAHWPGVSARIHRALGQGGRVLLQCLAGCGRSGAAALKLMVEAGERPEAALDRLRAARPCAVENDAQLRWASGDETR